MADSDDDDTVATHIENSVLRALADLTVKETEQEIDLRDVDDTLNDVNMQYMVDFICRNLSHMESLSLFFCTLSAEAVEILRTYLAQTPLQKIRLEENLDNEQSGRLLSGLHGNDSMEEVELFGVGLEGQIGGEIISDLLLNNSKLKMLLCGYNNLGLEGARSLQPGIRGNRAMHTLILHQCQLGDEGLAPLVDALQENNTISILRLDGNSITANDGLPHLTRLLQNDASLSLKAIAFDSNPGLFDHDENTRLFSMALSQCTKVTGIRMNKCQLQAHAIMALFQASAINKKLKHLYVYDHVQLQGQDLERLLETIPKVNLLALHINLDFMDKAVLSSFRSNTTIEQLLDDNNEEIAEGPVAGILARNNRLRLANQLLDSEPQRIIPLGLWANGIASIVDIQNGATGAYRILQEKLIMWWAPEASPAAVAAAAATPSAVKRSHAQASMENDDEQTDEAKSSSSFSEPQQKRTRRHLSPSKSNDKESSTTTTAATMIVEVNGTMTNIDSLSRKELMELIQHQKKKIADQANTIVTLVNSKSTDGAKAQEEDDQKKPTATTMG